MRISLIGGGARLYLKSLSHGHYGKLFVSGQRYKHFFENNVSQRKTSDYTNKIDKLLKSDNCHPELDSGSCHLQEYTEFNINKSNVGVGPQTYNKISHQRNRKSQNRPTKYHNHINGSKILNQVQDDFEDHCGLTKRNINTQNISVLKATRNVNGDLVPAFTLAEVFSPYYYSPRRAAFTLAEVLITLGIIGVVAAMTLPTLVANYKEKQRVTQLKKSYSVLQQAYLRAVEKHGDAQYWNLTPTETGEIDENGEQILDYSGSQKILGYLAENLNTQKPKGNLTYKSFTLDGRQLKSREKTPEEYVYLNDNSILIVGWVNNDETAINTDFMIMFPECIKRGCKLGVDLFYFKLDYNKGIIPTGTQSPELLNDLSLNFKQNCNRKSTSNTANGRACTAWVIFNENMDYLHCDDLSWDGKHKCK